MRSATRTSKGVVHRDIKPANIFMVGRTQPRVLDFGIARISHQHDMLGEDSITAGSPYYMSPEQLRQEPVDRRGDVFSLGVVFYELLTGHKPFRGGTLAEISEAVLNHQPAAANEIDPSIPAALAEIAARAMEKSPEHRYRSARGMSRDLRNWLEENAQMADEPVDVAPSRLPRLLIATVGVSALLLAGVAWWWNCRERAACIASAGAKRSPLRERTLPVPAGAHRSPNIGCRCNGAFIGRSRTGRGARRPQLAPKAAPARTAAAKDPPPRAAKYATRAPRGHAFEPVAAPAATGIVNIAVSPWGQVEVDGRDAGTTPPLSQLMLSEGTHRSRFAMPTFRRTPRRSPSTVRNPSPSDTASDMKSLSYRLDRAARRLCATRPFGRPDGRRRTTRGESLACRLARLRRWAIHAIRSATAVGVEDRPQLREGQGRREQASGVHLLREPTCPGLRSVVSRRTPGRPAFALTRAEAGHPMWGPVYKRVLQ